MPALTRKFAPGASKEEPEEGPKEACLVGDKVADTARKAEKLRAMQARLAQWQQQKHQQP